MCNFHQIYNDFLASGVTLPSDQEAYRQSNWQKKHFFCTAKNSSVTHQYLLKSFGII